MKRMISAGILLFAASLTLSGAEFKLTDGGKAVSCIVVSKDAGVVQKHAAEELSKFLGKISGGECPAVGTAPVAGKYPICLERTDDDKVGEEGFKITADKKALHIAGREEVGILYGVYEVLKKDGGIRWLIPGEEGEYFKVKPTISVKEGVRIKNPDFARRNINPVGMYWNSLIWDTWDWGVRNNMRFHMFPGVPATQKMYKDQILARAPFFVVGGHTFSPFMVGKDDPKKLFKEHPEYFPLIRGKRVFTSHGGGNPQPCTSNPDVIERVAQSAVRASHRDPGGCLVDFGNNDTTAWCTCPDCLAQDPPEETKEGNVSTRYWKFLNAVLKRAREIDPKLTMQGWTYQNFSVPPVGVKPDLRLTAVMLSNHRRCWKHTLDDPNCPTNGWYYKYNSDWNKTGVKLFTYDMLSRVGTYNLPAERMWVNTLKWYRKNMPNIIGMSTERSCPDGTYRKGKYDPVDIKHGWRQMWQSMYLAMYFHWDVDADFEKVSEEANSLYYGKGWEGGMKQYRALLEKLFMDAPGCWGYGHSSPVGKFLDVPGAKEKLEKYLDSAEKAAAEDPDKRALEHVKEARFHFQRTWLKNYNEYISNFREIRAYPLMDKIVLDGKLDEKDWKNADNVTRFKNAFKGGLAKYQTAVKVAYDPENIYVGVECLEPEPENLLNINTKHDGPVWDDNGVEIFLNDPIMGGAYYQIIINSLGTVCDGMASPRFDKSYESGAEAKIHREKDRYFMEIRIPARSITGSRIKPGTVLKMNVMRNRRVQGQKETEHSTWSTGTPHNVEVFHAVTFTGPRAIAPGSRYEVDTRFWRNGSFNELAPADRKLPKHWKVKDNRTPKDFSFCSGAQYGGDMEMVLHPGSRENYFLRLRKGFIFQFHKVKNKRLKAAFRIRGKGKLAFGMLRYTSKYRNCGSKNLKVVEVDSPEWKHMSFEFDRPSEDMTEIHAFMFQPVAGEVDLDDLYLVGLDDAQSKKDEK